jgi:hypothetical protein
VIRAPNVGVRRLVPMVRLSHLTPDLLMYALTHTRYPSNEAKQPRVCGLCARVDRGIPMLRSSCC